MLRGRRIWYSMHSVQSARPGCRCCRACSFTWCESAPRRISCVARLAGPTPRSRGRWAVEKRRARDSLADCHSHGMYLAKLIARLCDALSPAYRQIISDTLLLSHNQLMSGTLLLSYNQLMRHFNALLKSTDEHSAFWVAPSWPSYHATRSGLSSRHHRLHLVSRRRGESPRTSTI
jgi:hypothetical protein